jgi:hypothetical protein
MLGSIVATRCAFPSSTVLMISSASIAELMACLTRRSAVGPW